MTELNLELDGFDSTPTMPIVQVVRMRATDLAASLEQATQQGYVEANVLAKALELLKEVVALLPAM